MHMARRKSVAFTLVELLVVLLIIALLIGIAIPAFDALFRRSQATVSQQQLRQWGVAASSLAADEKGKLPEEGLWAADLSGDGSGEAEMSANMDDPAWWANALGPYINEPSYGELAALPNQTPAAGELPIPSGKSSIYIDPTAQLPDSPDDANVPGGTSIPYPTNDDRQYFFTYAWNSRLDDTFRRRQEEQFGSGGPSGSTLQAIIDKRVPTSKLGNAGETVLMFEMRTVKQELISPAADPDPYYEYRLDQHKADWSRFAARHDDGGHVLFADGHIDRFLNAYAIAPVEEEAPGTGFSGPGGGTGPILNFNKRNLIWDPLGPATEN